MRALISEHGEELFPNIVVPASTLLDGSMPGYTVIQTDPEIGKMAMDHYFLQIE